MDITSLDTTGPWVDQIAKNRMVWTRLSNRLTDKTMMVVEPGMVVELVDKMAKNKVKFQNTIRELLSNEKIRKEVVEFINNNPEKFEDIETGEPAGKK